MRWFGESWRAPVCEDVAHEETPVGAVCLGCEARIELGAQGVTMPAVAADGSVHTAAFHLACIRSSLGIE
jgi:hypothetical protein